MIRGEWPLVGRDRLVARAMASLAESHGSLLVGPAGAGKSRIARACAVRAEAAGWAVEWIRAAEAPPDTPLGALSPLLAAAPGPATPESLLQAAHAEFRARAAGAPLVVIVDDAHLLDQLSATFLHQLLVSGATAALCTVRAGDSAPEGLVELWKSGLLERIDVDTLDKGEVHELLSRILGGPVDMELGVKLWRASEGNPLYLRELVHAAWDDGALEWANGVWRLSGRLSSSPTLVALVEHQLDGLEPAAREVLELLAVGEPLDLDHLASVADLDLLTDLELRHLLQVTEHGDRELVRLGHPVYAEVLREALSATRRREVLRRLAATAAGTTPVDARRLARWRVEGGLATEVEELVGAAEAARQVFDLPFAERCARAAYRQSATARCGQVLGDTLALASKHEEAEVVLSEVEGLAVTDDEIVAAAQARAHNLVHNLGRPDDARRVSIRAQSQVAADEARRRLRCHQASFDWVAGRALRGWEAVEPLLGNGNDPVDFETAMVASRLCLALGRLSAARELLGRVAPGDARADEVRAAYYPSLSTVAEVYGLLLAGRLDDVVTAAGPGHERAIESGDLVTRGFLAYYVGMARLLGGRVVTAGHWLREAVSTFGTLGPNPRGRLAQAGLVRALSLGGDLDGARQASTRLEEGFPHGWPGFEAEVVGARAALAALAGDVGGAAGRLAELAPALGDAGNYVHEAATLHDLLRLGRADRRHRARLIELGEVVEGDLMGCRAAHAEGVDAPGWAGLAAAADGFEQLGMDLYAAEVWQAAAARAADGGESRAAASFGNRSRRLLAACEGARTPALAPAPAPGSELTAREREIAVLAARGLASQAIADTLYLSRRTVDNQLQRAYRKLGVRRRAELGAALGGVDEGTPPAGTG